MRKHEVRWRVAKTEHGHVVQGRAPGGKWQFHHYVPMRQSPSDALADMRRVPRGRKLGPNTKF